MTTPDHKEIGQVLKAKYNKDLKAKLSGNLTREEVLEYLQKGKVTINGVEILEGWLKISKEFNEKYSKNSSLGVEASQEAPYLSIMLDISVDEKLKEMRMAREIVNKVQKLRKAAGLHIDD